MTKGPDDSAAWLARLQRNAFRYFWTEVNPTNGLVVDSTKEGWPASIAAIGMALAIYPIGVQRGFITRKKRSRERSPHCASSGRVRREPRPTRLGIVGSIITFWICKGMSRALLNLRTE
jgi:hypothetical protein